MREDLLFDYGIWNLQHVESCHTHTRSLFTMSQLCCASDQVSCFLDDIGVFDSTFDSHMESLDKVLKNLQDNNFTVNPLKCEWAIKETDQLGYWLTPQGLKPWKKKIDAILNMEAPKNV